MTVIDPAPSTTINAAIQVFPEVEPGPGEPLTLAVEGELEQSTAALFSTALSDAVALWSGPVLLDLGRLYRLDLTGLDAIAGAAADLARDGRRLVLACVRPRVREFLALAGAEALVPMFPTLEQAALHM